LENTAVLNSPFLLNGNSVVSDFALELKERRKPNFSPDNFSLTAEGGKNLFRYLKSFNLSGESDLLILPPNAHYYYDKDDLKNVRTIINLRKLNYIKDLDLFFKTLIQILPANVNFVGCYSDRKSGSRKGFLTGLSYRVTNFLDSRTNHFLDKKEVTHLLTKWGFNIIDMTESNGLTYFYSQKANHHIEVRA
jgi:hypothetical protein